MRSGASGTIWYKIDVYVDGNLVATESNAAINNGAGGVSANFVTISNTCKMRIRYNGPAAQVKIFK